MNIKNTQTIWKKKDASFSVLSGLIERSLNLSHREQAEIEEKRRDTLDIAMDLIDLLAVSKTQEEFIDKVEQYDARGTVAVY